MAPIPASRSAHQPPVQAVPVCGGRRCRFAVLGADAAVHGSFGIGTDRMRRDSRGPSPVAGAGTEKAPGTPWRSTLRAERADLLRGQTGCGVAFEPVGGGLDGRAPHGPCGGRASPETATAWPRYPGVRARTETTKQATATATVTARDHRVRTRTAASSAPSVTIAIPDQPLAVDWARNHFRASDSATDAMRWSASAQATAAS
ncbi:hypothetical protein GCM10009849_30240 [Sinomonas flava]|uniref:Uncharacterized protein n=1 Tax=Sinomonas flava TaxID=496857 RepID=A0ABN3C057_9MICC